MTGDQLDVWFVCNSWTGGGAERVTSTMLQHLDRSRLRPSLCLLRTDIRYPLPEDVPVHHLGYRGVASIFSAARRLRRLVESRRPGAIVSTVNANALLTGLALRRSGHHPTWIARIGNEPRRHDRGLRGVAAGRIYPLADRYVVNSQGLHRALIAKYPFVSGRVEVIPNPTDFVAIDRMASEATAIERPSGPLLISAGRLAQQKRLDILLRAFALVRGRIPATLWVCGDGPRQKALRRHAEKLGVDSSIGWLGFQDNPYALMRTADLFVLTSDYEGLPNALIEAQGLGLPAVSTRCPTGPEEIIEDGVTGMLVPVGDAAAVAEAVVSILGDAEKASKMGARAAETTRARFDCGPLTREWEHAIVRAAGGGRGAGSQSK
jgi:glycosyltransferase involved in cell wall biosynthesis